MRYGVRAAVLIGAVMLGGSEGILDPKGPIASAERRCQNAAVEQSGRRDAGCRRLIGCNGAYKSNLWR
jgi:hypothetical protein